ncbi:MAG: hypothetical protein LQ346_004094 [Caloplaca aetnensis]|nr:MAG: hypothetical protein LQ346_004094 [Caloplaca aetnensis]
MKTFSIATALAVLTSLAAATPTPASPPYDFVQITFLGAADASFIQYFQTNGYGSGIYNVLSVSKITNPSNRATCYFYGVDGSQTTVSPGTTADVGPPQQLSYGYCYGY